MAFIAAIQHNLKNLTTFTGRETAGVYWPYAGLVLGLILLVSMIGMAFSFGGMIEDIEALAAESPDAVRIERSPGHYSATIAPGSGVMPDVSAIFIPMGVSVFIGVLLLAAATTRRLHDRGLTGFLALAPVALLFTGMAIFSILFSQFDTGEPDLRLFAVGFVNNIAYLLCLVLLLVQLAGASTTKPTKHGPIPD